MNPVVATISGTEVYEPFPTVVNTPGTTFTPIPIKPNSTSRSSSTVKSSRTVESSPTAESSNQLARRQVAIGTGGLRETVIAEYGTNILYEAVQSSVYYPTKIVVGTAGVYREIIGAATTGSSAYPLSSGYAQNGLYYPGSIPPGIFPSAATAVAIGETFGIDRIYHRAVGTAGVYNEFIGYKKAAGTGTRIGTEVASTGGYSPTAGTAASARIYRRQEVPPTSTATSIETAIGTPVTSASVADIILLPGSEGSSIPNPTPLSTTIPSTIVSSVTEVAVFSASPISTLASYPIPSAAPGVSPPFSGIVGAGETGVYPTGALPSGQEPIIPANSGAEATVGRRSAVATFALVVCGIMAMLV